MVRTVVIGFGNMGSAHVAAISQGKINGLSLWGVCDVDAGRREICGQKYPQAKLYENFEQVMEDPLVEAVIVAVPHPFHADIAMAALVAHKHVLVEKPVDVAVSKALALNAAAEKSDRVFALMLNQRTNPVFQKAREIVQSGQLGEIRRSVWIITNWYRTQHYYDSATWRATWKGEGGGVLLNQAPHNLDLWQWICGMPVSLKAFCAVAKYHRIEVEDDVTIMARYANGGEGVFITSTGEYPGTNRLEITGDRGKLVLENGVLHHWKLKESEQEFRFRSEENFAHIPMEYSEYKPETEGAGHAGILQNFADAILHGAELLSPGQEGIKELSISNAAYLSQWNGNREIPLPFEPALFDVFLKERIAESVQGRREGKNHSVYEGYSERWQVNW